MISNTQRQIDQLQNEIATLDRDGATQAKKEADLIAKINRLSDSMSRSTSPSTFASKLRELERHHKALGDVKKKQADLSGRRSAKSKKLGEHRARQAREEEQARKKRAADERKLMREREAHQQRVSASLTPVGSMTEVTSFQPLTQPIQPLVLPIEPLPAVVGHSEAGEMDVKTYDFFISHASEDKEHLVRSLATLLESKGARVWFDEISLKPGDSLHREINRGLRQSKIGIVVLSQHFFKKEWAQKELDGLVALANAGQARVVPLWHKVTVGEVRNNNPMLADLLALNTSVNSIEEIADKLMEQISQTTPDPTG